MCPVVGYPATSKSGDTPPPPPWPQVCDEDKTEGMKPAPEAERSQISEFQIPGTFRVLPTLSLSLGGLEADGEGGLGVTYFEASLGCYPLLSGTQAQVGVASVSLTVAKVMATVDTGTAGSAPGQRRSWESPRQQSWVRDRRPSAQAEDRTLCFDYFQFPDPQVVI